jgi:hypothetical protein
MKNRLIVISAVAAFCFMSVMTMAQSVDQAEVKQITQKYDLGLSKPPSTPFFDLSRIHISQSYSIGFFSGGGTSGSQALYNGTLTYQLAQPLTLTLNMGILHDPSSLWGNNRFGTSAKFLPSGWLDWRPSKNFMMSIGFETRPASYYNGYDWMGRYQPWHY